MARKAEVKRKTGETTVSLKLDLDGSGDSRISTGIGFLDHMLSHLAFHGLLDLELEASGDLEVDQHHTVEDIALCLGRALSEALGDKKGLRRYGEARVPMDESLAEVSVDLSGRAAVVWRVVFISSKIGDFDSQLVEEFFRRLALEVGMSLHVSVPWGTNDHHVAEAVFKAVARAIRIAKSTDPDRKTGIPSTKGEL